MSTSPAWFDDPNHRGWRYLSIGLIVSATLARVAYLLSTSAVNLSPDEAHYWSWSRHLDWAYYSKGPLVAWLIRTSTELFGTSMFSVRLPALICGVLILSGIRTLALQLKHGERFAAVAVLVALSLPLTHAGCLMMTIDAPFLACWTWAMVFGREAILDQRFASWLKLGATIAVGILAKYTMLLLPWCLTLFLLSQPTLRAKLFSRGYWLALGIAFLGCVPILWWNWQHQGVGYLHVAQQTGLHDPTFEESLFRWNGPLVMIFGQFGLMLGFWFIAWLITITQREPDREIRYLWWNSVPVFGLFLAFSFWTGVQANWPAPLWVGGIILTLDFLRTVWHFHLVRIVTTGTVMLGLLGGAWVHDLHILRPLLVEFLPAPSENQPLPIRTIDPTCRLRGWDALGIEVDRHRQSMGNAPAILATNWSIPAIVSFYCTDHPEAYTLGRWIGDRMSQFDIWRPNPLDDAQLFLGRSFIYVGPEVPVMKWLFSRIEGPYVVEHCENGVPLARWTIWRCYDFQGFNRIPPIDRENRY